MAPKFKTTLILMLILVVNITYAHKEYFNWYFGNKSGITFDTKDLIPIYLDDSEMYAQEGCSSISGKYGGIKFYTNGETVWNRLHTIMPNGTGLGGHGSSTQSTIIIRQPESEDIYYIFTTQAYESRPDTRFAYSIVDMRLDGKRGGVSQKNSLLYIPTTEKLAAAYHDNNTDIWVLTHGWENDTFYVHKLTNTGLALHRKVAIGAVHNNIVGQMKISPTCDKIALISDFINADVQVFDFNDVTGEISNPVTLNNVVGKNAYGLEFSPDGTKLYVSSNNYSGRDLVQINLSDENRIAQLWPPSGNNDRIEFGALQLGPDGKIYAVTSPQHKLSVIHSPDEVGNACAFVVNSNTADKTETVFGLPNILVGGPDLVLYANDACDGDSILLKMNFVMRKYGSNFRWTGPNNFSAHTREAVIRPARKKHEGWYYASAVINGAEHHDSIYVKVSKVEAEIEADPGLISCNGERIKLTASPIRNEYEYFWSTGQQSEQISVNTSGIYQLTVVDKETGCSESVEVECWIGNPNEEIIEGNKAICESDNAVLRAKREFFSYNWSTGENSREITVNKPGKYILTVIDIKGCEISDTIELELLPKPDAEIVGDDIFCEGTEIQLQSAKEYSSYLWSTGETTREINIKEHGVYTLIVRNEADCCDTTEFKTEYYPEDHPEIDGPESICKGEEGTLISVKDYDSYQWSTGETTKEIIISKAGKYWLKVINSFGCYAYDTIIVYQNSIEEIEILGDTEFCDGDEIRLEVSRQEDTYAYEWSTGETTPGITVSEGGEYILTVTNEDGCSGSDTITVIKRPLPEAEITGDKQFCEGSHTILSADKDYSEYLWSTGETTKEITVTETGAYELSVKNENGCSDNVKAMVLELPSPEPRIIAPETICKGSDVVLKADKDYDAYEWSTGETSKEISVSEEGKYSLKVSDENGCEGYDTVQIKYIEMELEVGPSLIDYQLVWLENDEQATIRIDNKNNFDIEYELGNIASVFDINGYAGDIRANDSEILEIVFTPGDIVDYDDVLKINITKPCVREYNIELKGGGKAELQARIKDTYAMIGSQACIPVYAKINAENISSIANLDMQIELDARALETNIDGNIVNLRRIIEINKSNLTIDENETKIGEICGMVLIGNEDASPVQFAEFIFSDKHLVIDTTNGFLFHEGVCKRDISRIKKFEPTIMSISPVPARENIKINIKSEDKGAFVLKIYNLQGMEMGSYFWNATSKIDQEIIIDTEDYSGGLYQAVLTGPWGVYRESIVIME